METDPLVLVSALGKIHPTTVNHFTLFNKLQTGKVAFNETKRESHQTIYCL